MSGANSNGRPWPVAHDAVLQAALTEGFSHEQCASLLNKQFGTVYTRNSTIGRAHRTKMTQPDRKMVPKRGPKRYRKPKAPPKPNPSPEFTSAPVAILLRTADIVPLNLSIYDLTDETCRWPLADDPPQVFCGCPTVEGSPYCLDHKHIGTSADFYSGHRRGVDGRI